MTPQESTALQLERNFQQCQTRDLSQLVVELEVLSRELTELANFCQRIESSLAKLPHRLEVQ